MIVEAERGGHHGRQRGGRASQQETLLHARCHRSGESPGRAAACVSSGNTSALMAISKFVLKTVPGIDRPAICTTIPAT